MFTDLREKGRDRQRNINVREKQRLVRTPAGYQTCNLVVWPDEESNPQLFDVRDDAPTSWATQPGLIHDI